MEKTKLQKIADGRKILGSYNRMKLEIDMLAKKIEFYTDNKQAELDEDIQSLSVSHPAENSGGSNPNDSNGKIPGIAEKIGIMSADYDARLSEMKTRQSVYKFAVSGIDSFVTYLPEEQALIIKRLYLGKKRKTFGEISAEINLTERRIKQITSDILLNFCNSLKNDADYILKML